MMTRKCLCTLGIALSLGAATAQQRWLEPGAAGLAIDGSVTGFALPGGSISACTRRQCAHVNFTACLLPNFM